MNCLCKTRLRVQDESAIRFTQDQYIRIRHGDYDWYEGAYEVTPRLYTQTLDTDHKIMSDDVTIDEIPITRTSNPQDGLTVLIG